MVKKETRRATLRYSRSNRTVIVPERNIDRFYLKYKFMRQPELRANQRY